MRAGVVASAALVPHMKPGHKPPGPGEFILFRFEEDGPAKPTQSLAEMKAIFSQAKQAFESTRG